MGQRQGRGYAHTLYNAMVIVLYKEQQWNNAIGIEWKGWWHSIIESAKTTRQGVRIFPKLFRCVLIFQR
jgi:hypothetical protein